MFDSISCNGMIETIMEIKLFNSERELISILKSSVDWDDHLLSSDISKELGNKSPDFFLVLPDVGGNSVPSPENFVVSVVIEIVGFID